MKDPITQAARKIVADEAGAALHEIACELSTLAGEVDELKRTAKAGQGRNYRERIKDAIRDYTERHAHCQEQDGRRRWKRKRHCSPAGGKGKRWKGGKQ